MAVSITLTVRLGPLVSLRVNGNSCRELAEALEGYDGLNERLEAMCSGLAEKVYPEGMEEAETGAEPEDEGDQEESQ